MNSGHDLFLYHVEEKNPTQVEIEDVYIIHINRLSTKADGYNTINIILYNFTQSYTVELFKNTKNKTVNLFLTHN